MVATRGPVAGVVGMVPVSTRTGPAGNARLTIAAA